MTMWRDLTMQLRSDLMRATGIFDPVRLRQEYDAYHLAQGGHIGATGMNMNPDWDPNNPYHYHTANGEKVVVKPLDWETHKDWPYFKLIQDAVLAELAAHPGPEYIINPQFVSGLKSIYKGNMGPLYQNYSSFKDSLPQGYSFTTEGLILDRQGNLYVLKGFRQTPRFTYDESNPLTFTLMDGDTNKGNVTFYPVNMEMINPVTPVSRIMDVDSERNLAIEDYIRNNSGRRYRQPYVISQNDPNHYGVTTIFKGTDYVNTGYTGSEDPIDVNEVFSHWSSDIGYVTKDEADRNLRRILEERLNNPGRLTGFPNTVGIYKDTIGKLFTPSRKQAEQRAVIEVGPLQVNDILTYAKGGHIHQSKSFMDFKSPEEILNERYNLEQPAQDNVVLKKPVVTQQMENLYLDTPKGKSKIYGTIGQAENTNAFQRKVRQIRNSDNPMWYGAYSVPYLGSGMLAANSVERFMSGQYGLGFIDLGLSVLPGLQKLLKPLRSIAQNRGFAISNASGHDIAWIPLNRRLSRGLSNIELGLNYYGPASGELGVSYIKSAYSGEGRKLYDAAIKHALRYGYDGLVSGERLLSAPKTFNTYQHYYPDRRLLSNKGYWENRNMRTGFSGLTERAKDIDEFMLLSGNGAPVSLNNAPIYMLDKPYSDVVLLKFPNFGKVEGLPRKPKVTDGLIGDLTVDLFSKGGSIHIKHPGRLTTLKKRTGKTEAELWATGNKDYRRMITFARNARKFKHLDGGYLDDIIWDNMGLWSHPGQITGITGTKNGTDITMNGVADYLIGKDNLGNVKFMKPGMNYHFPGSSVVEYPMSSLSHKAQDGKKLIITPEQELQAKMRYSGYFNAMVNNGINPAYARDAAYYATLQSFAEAGWKPNKHNNYGGMKNSKGLISYPSEEAYFDAWVKNANNKWPEYYKSKSILDWDEALNHTSLGLFDKDLFYKYLKKNPDTYIYAPAWENDSYLNKMQGVKNRMDGALGVYPDDVFLEYTYNQDPLNQRIENNQIAQTYQYGGLIKPFSYTDIPVVRYGNGGNLFLEDLSEMKVLPINQEGIPEYTLPEVLISSFQPQSLKEFSPYRNYFSRPNRLKKDFKGAVKENWGRLVYNKMTNEINNAFNSYIGDNKQRFDDLQEASGFFNQYVNSPIYLQRLENAGVNKRDMRYRYPKIRVVGYNPNGAYNGGSSITIPLYFNYEDMNAGNDEILVHEMTHSNPLFNSAKPFRWIRGLTDLEILESPYYGNDYSNIPLRWKELLKPENPMDEHDVELNESYSDLQALRYILYKNGIWNSLNPLKDFGEDEYNRLLELKNNNGVIGRYLRMHDKQRTIDAINEIAQNNVRNNGFTNYASYGGFIK